MEIYFFDENKRYIGHRSLQNEEAIPVNATVTPAIVSDGQQAHLIDGAWVVSQIIEVEHEV